MGTKKVSVVLFFGVQILALAPCASAAALLFRVWKYASGRVLIDDLNPDRFKDFMEYVYTGHVESFCDDNAFGLYAEADKYDLPTLKSECVECMRRGLSVDNFCNVLTLALRHHERDLLELAVEFFKKNVAAIILTVKWQQFMSENSARANELLIKLHVPGRESDDVLLP